MSATKSPQGTTCSICSRNSRLRVFLRFRLMFKVVCFMLHKICSMKQTTLNINLNLKKTRKREFLEQMEQVVPWGDLVALIAPYYPEGNNGRPPFALQTMLRTHFMQQWFTLSDPAMEEAFFDTPLYREFAQLDEFARLPDESTILRFRHRLEKHLSL